MTKEIPQYKVAREGGYFNGKELIPEGTIIEHDGAPGDHLEPVNDAAKKVVKEHAESGDQTSAPSLTLTNGGPESGSPGGGGSSGDAAEIKRLRHKLAQAEAKLVKDAPDTVVVPDFEPGAMALVDPKTVEEPSNHTGAFAADVDDAKSEMGHEPEKRGPGRPRKS